MSTEQAAFLARHGIALEQVFDATGMTKGQYGPLMSALGKRIALCVAPCKAGHTMRTGGGNCPQCSTAALAFHRRHREAGTVYIAGSRAARLLKVGSTGYLAQREETLNSQQYASQDDWVVVAHVACSQAGAVEAKIHDLLERYRHPATHFRDGQVRDTREVFNCGYPIARHAVARALPEAALAKLWEKPGADKLYAFFPR